MNNKKKLYDIFQKVNKVKINEAEIGPTGELEDFYGEDEFQELVDDIRYNLEEELKQHFKRTNYGLSIPKEIKLMEGDLKLVGAEDFTHTETYDLQQQFTIHVDYETVIQNVPLIITLEYVLWFTPSYNDVSGEIDTDIGFTLNDMYDIKPKT